MKCLREMEKEIQKAYDRLCICKARNMRTDRSQARYDLLVMKYKELEANKPEESEKA